jgi:hypothetical protein
MRLQSGRAGGRRGGHVPYSVKDVDFLVAYISSLKVWYVIPIRALGGRLTIKLYPLGSRRDSERHFEKYREAWELLEEAAARRS